jgi:hypothetical protein
MKKINLTLKLNNHSLNYPSNYIEISLKHDNTSFLKFFNLQELGCAMPPLRADM